ncbi:hypothetical protein [Paraburkholderia sp. SOS3]|uniref:hypothetical protein n=1 Tax=Paraburkholderia sp. SOS3 TaxID=1926494 RepID=UPI0009474AC7|nr:hypothetical protein [Paraburkholderia sp. SOS3]APR35215.1 hypothetical protein BTO02_06995 [Paraburkholderia sp. SOS3]
MHKKMKDGGTYSSTDELLSDANARVAVGDIASALRLIQEFVQSVIGDPRTVAKIFANNSLDTFCRDLGARVLESLPASNKKNGAGECGPVFLATELYSTGGHTAVLEDLLKGGSFPGRAVILLTNLMGTANLEVIQQRFAPYDVDVQCAPDAGPEAKLVWLLERLRDLHATHLFLFNHHQDSVAVAAAQRGLAQQTVFYHHADHHLCLGVTLDYDLHADCSPMGFHHCRDELDVCNTVYWPLTASDCGVSEFDGRSQAGGHGLRTCTAGTRNKFEQPYQYDFGDLLPKILNATRGTHVHFGLLSEPTLTRIRDGMQSLGIAAERLTYIEWVPSVWKALQEQMVDLYFSSFPIAGARAVVEALGSGTPVIAHESYLSRFHGAMDMLYPEAFTWKTPDALLAHLAVLEPQRIEQERKWARERYEQMHAPEALRAAIHAGLDAPPAAPLRPYSPDLLQTFLDERQTMPAVDTIRKQLIEVDGELRRSRETLDGIYASRSWRLTMAIRSLTQKLRRQGASH